MGLPAGGGGRTMRVMGHYGGGARTRLAASSPQQIYLANQLGFVPPRFTHLPLLCNAAGQRLSKRDRSLDMEALRSRFEAEEIIGMLAYKAGLQESPERVTAEELVAGFDWSNIGITDIEF